jgi:uncharacterized membrane protein
VHSKPFRILCVSVVVVCCLAVGTVGGTTIDSTGVTDIGENAKFESGTPDSSALQQLQQSNASISETDIRIAVRANDSAIWTVQYRFRLATPNETAAFDRLRADIASNSTHYRERFRQRMAEAVASAERTTGREMAIENAGMRAARNGTTGVVSYEFVWRNFAVTDGNRIRLGDALVGLYLDDGTRLTIGWPAEYETVTVRPAPTDRRPNAVSWAGSTEFDGSEPIVGLVRSDAAADGTGSGDEGSSGTPTIGTELPLSSIGLAVLVLLVGGLGVAWFARQRQTADSPIGVVASDPDESRETLVESVLTTSDDTANPGSTENPKPTENPEFGENDDGPSADLLSNKERVVEVLKRSDGRMKQQQIVNELGWTDAKTSSVVSQLRDEGTIEGFRLGRENVLELADEKTESGTDDSPTDT